MAFVVEDGTGLSNANSLVSVAEADAYFTDRGNTVWTGLSTATKEALLIKATDYMEQIYSEAWVYTIYSDTQSLSWPRLDDYNNKVTTPNRVKYACIELAFKANSGDLLIDIEKRTVKESVGSISVEYAEFANQQTQYSAVYSLVKPYLISGSSINRPTARV